MNLLLINPRDKKPKGNIWPRIRSTMPPLGMGWIASNAEKHGHRVRIIDLCAEYAEGDALVRRIRAGDAPDFVGIGAMTETINQALGIAALCRKNFPGAKTILGGVHPSTAAAEVLADANVDMLVRGEGEITVSELLDGKPLKDVPGVSFRENGAVVNNPDRPLIPDLDSLPFPAYHLLPIRRYHPALGAYRRLPGMSMITTRGCPGRCTFCVQSFLGSTIRKHSTAYIIGQIELLQKDYGIREISFYDDTFTVFKPRIFELCGEIHRRNIDITWSCFARIDLVEEKMLKEMKRAGCHQIMYGIESVDAEVMKNVNKKVGPEKVRAAVELARDAGLNVRGAFMLGNPGETEETMKANIEFARKLDIYIAVFNITTPYPGTELYKWADQNGYLKVRDWNRYDLATAIMDLPTVSGKTIEKYYRIAYRRYYLDPLYIMRRLLQFRNWEEFKMLLRAARAILGF